MSYGDTIRTAHRQYLQCEAHARGCIESMGLTLRPKQVMILWWFPADAGLAMEDAEALGRLTRGRFSAVDLLQDGYLERASTPGGLLVLTDKGRILRDTISVYMEQFAAPEDQVETAGMDRANFRLRRGAQGPFTAVAVGHFFIVLDGLHVNSVYPLKPGAVFWSSLEIAEAVATEATRLWKEKE